MTQIFLRTEIAAPVQLCFDLSRSIDLHQLSTAKTKEKAIAGRTNGLIKLGETVTWRAKHFGIWLTLTSKITEFNSPNYFVDEMTQGPFRSLHHLHEFASDGQKTLMVDTFNFESPFGLLGNLFNRIILRPYLKELLLRRNETIKQYAENDLGEKLIQSLT